MSSLFDATAPPNVSRDDSAEAMPNSEVVAPRRTRWDHQFESGFLQQRVECELDGAARLPPKSTSAM
jgi:hypothetical protein